MEDPIYEGVVGLPIRLVLLTEDEVYDPSEAAVIEMTIVPPTGTKRVLRSPDVRVSETRDGRPCLEYKTKTAEELTAGKYIVVGYIEDDAGSWPAAPVSFNVLKSPRG